MGPIISLATVLAHQGGWDEVMLVGIPILLIIGLLVVAKRRVDAQFGSDQPDEAGQPPTER
jgi:hypothetical protein